MPQHLRCSIVWSIGWWAKRLRVRQKEGRDTAGVNGGGGDGNLEEGHEETVAECKGLVCVTFFPQSSIRRLLCHRSVSEHDACRLRLCQLYCGMCCPQVRESAGRQRKLPCRTREGKNKSRGRGWRQGRGMGDGGWGVEGSCGGGGDKRDGGTSGKRKEAGSLLVACLLCAQAATHPNKRSWS